MYALKSYSNIPDFEKNLKLVKSDIIKFATQNSRVKLTIKLHPLEDDSLIKELTSDDSNIVIVSGAADIRDYIKECDVFITLGSTATIDAILLGKAVIFPNYDGLVWWDDIYLKSAVTIQAPTSKRLENLLQNLAPLLEVNESVEMSRNRNAFISKWVYFSDEESSKIILRATGLIH
jgi:CDP-glycerol glycerophosphotransferase (TagB/SpsB family)